MKRLLLLFILSLGLVRPLLAQTESGRVSHLEVRVTALEQKITSLGDQGLVLFLFGVVCALWAQTTGRNPWLWFFLGLFFNVITVLVLLSKNSQDRRDGSSAGRKRFDLEDFRQQ